MASQAALSETRAKRTRSRRGGLKSSSWPGGRDPPLRLRGDESLHWRQIMARAALWMISADAARTGAGTLEGFGGEADRHGARGLAAALGTAAPVFLRRIDNVHDDMFGSEIGLGDDAAVPLERPAAERKTLKLTRTRLRLEPPMSTILVTLHLGVPGQRSIRQVGRTIWPRISTGSLPAARWLRSASMTRPSVVKGENEVRVSFPEMRAAGTPSGSWQFFRPRVCAAFGRADGAYSAG